LKQCLIYYLMPLTSSAPIIGGRTLFSMWREGKGSTVVTGFTTFFLGVEGFKPSLSINLILPGKLMTRHWGTWVL
jgi:hypothetical protein